MIYVQDGNLSQAEESLKWSLETKQSLNDQEDSLPSAFLGMLYEIQKDFDSAIEHYQHFLFA